MFFTVYNTNGENSKAIDANYPHFEDLCTRDWISLQFLKKSGVGQTGMKAPDDATLRSLLKIRSDSGALRPVFELV